jgi:hypothetical protein
VWKVLTFKHIRDTVLLCLGVVIALNETLLSPPPDVNALLFAAACLGVTAALRQDEKS